MGVIGGIMEQRVTIDRRRGRNPVLGISFPSLPFPSLPFPSSVVGGGTPGIILASPGHNQGAMKPRVHPSLPWPGRGTIYRNKDCNW